MLKGENQIGFEVGNYNIDEPLVIDPVLVFSTYLGGDVRDVGNAIAVDPLGNVYVTGETASTNFPIANSRARQTGSEVFITKFDKTGSLIYSTYLGGDNFDRAFGIAVDNNGNAYVTGETRSSDFPTVNAFQEQHAAATIFVSKLNPDGELLYSTYFIGELGWDIAVDRDFNIYFTGRTLFSPLFPITPGVFQPIFGGGHDAFVVKMNAAGSSLIYCSYSRRIPQ